MNPSRKKYTTIDEYIADFPKDIQVILENLRTVIQEIAPDAVEAISYQMPTFKFRKKNLVHFAAYQKHIGFYPTPSGIENFAQQLSKYQFSKGAIRFPLNQPIPYDLVKEIVNFRIKEVSASTKK